MVFPVVMYGGESWTLKKTECWRIDAFQLWSPLDWKKIKLVNRKAVYCHPVYLTSMQSTSWETLDWKKHKLESGLLGEISITSDMQMTPPLWQRVKRNSKASCESESGEWKSWLKAQHSENEDHGIWSHHFMGNNGETVETVSDFIFLGSKITADGDCSHEIKRCLLLGRKVMTNLDSIFKSRDIALPTKVRLVKAMVFPVVMYGCESWTVKKAERRRIDAFELWCWRRLFRVPWTARRSTSPFWRRSALGFLCKEWCWSWNSRT